MSQLSKSCQRLVAALVALVAALAVAGPASALSCGSLGQVPCLEDPPPGVQLTLSDDENPFGLQPLTNVPTPNQPLWPRVRGHKPYGFNAVSAGTEGTTVTDEASLHEQIGAAMARIPVDWAVIQYSPWNSPSVGAAWNYDAVDRQYRAYIARGVRPLLTIIRAPRRFTNNALTLANSDAPGCGTTDLCWNPPRLDQAFRLETLAADLATRYPLMAGVEVWNEPNISNPFWGRESVDPVRYGLMLKAAHQGIKSVAPAIPVLGGALANLGTTTADLITGYKQMAMRTFLRRMLLAGGAADMDAVSFHPYIAAFPTGITDLAAQQRFLNHSIAWSPAELAGAYTDVGQPINDRVVVTEFGASTSTGYTPEQQSFWLRQQYMYWDTDNPFIALTNRTDAAFIHQAVEVIAPAYGNTWQAGYGLTLPRDAAGGFTPKPAFCDWRITYGGFTDCPASLVPPAG